MSNPLEDYLMEKEAKKLPSFGQVAGSTAIQFGVAAALTAVPAVAQKVVSAVTKRHSYNKMLEQNPDLVAARDDNPQVFNNIYNSFHRLNPEFASDPTVAGSYMNRMTANPEAAGSMIVESLKGAPTRPTFNEALRTGAQTGTKAFGSGFNQMQFGSEEDD